MRSSSSDNITNIKKTSVINSRGASTNNTNSNGINVEFLRDELNLKSESDKYLKLFNNIKKRLATKVKAHTYEAYLLSVKFISLDESSNNLYLTANSALVCRYFVQNFQSVFYSQFKKTFNIDLTIKISVDSNLENKNLKQVKPKFVVKKVTSKKDASFSAVNRKTSDLNVNYNFNNFVVGGSNEFTHAASLLVSKKPGEKYNPLFIYGGVGLGKTHLLHAIGNAVLEKNKSVLYMSSETFTNELIQSLKIGKMDVFKNKLRNIDVLLIDDIQFIAGKERTQEEFFHTFNTLYNNGNQIVITSDTIPQEIKGIEERLKTRFAWGLTADLQTPDFETRSAIIRKKADREGLNLPEDVVSYISEIIATNIRELEGALTRLQALASLRNTPIDIDLAEIALEKITKPKAKVSISDIKGAVAVHFKLKVSEIVSKRRTRNLSFPRHIAMYLCRKHTTASYPEIGQNFGGRDHSSVIHAANVVQNKLNEDKEIGKILVDIEKKLFT